MNNKLTTWVLILIAALSPQLRADEDSLNWFTVDGGGDTSAADGYSLSGTIGQPDAGRVMVGGAFSLQGGFWSAFDTHIAETGPALAITLAPDGRVRISWAPNSPGYVLQETPLLSAGEWTNVPEGNINPRLIPPNFAARYYRLRRP